MKPEQWRPSTALRKRRSRYVSTIDVSGFVGIMLFFLCLFMLPALLHVHPSRSFDLAQSHHAKPQPGALKEDAMVVGVSRDGSFYFRSRKVPIHEIAPLIRDAVKAGSERKVYLKADARAKYGDVKAVVDQIRLAGIENVALMTEQTNRAPAR
jgi:biopolymer transport protein ExbD